MEEFREYLRDKSSSKSYNCYLHQLPRKEVVVWARGWEGLLVYLESKGYVQFILQKKNNDTFHYMKRRIFSATKEVTFDD